MIETFLFMRLCPGRRILPEILGVPGNQVGGQCRGPASASESFTSTRSALQTTLVAFWQRSWC